MQSLGNSPFSRGKRTRNLTNLICLDSSLQAILESVKKVQKKETFSGAKSVVAMLLAVTRGRLGFAAQSPYFVLLEGQTNSDLDKSYMPGHVFPRSTII